MSLKKIFCGIFNCERFAVHESALANVDVKVQSIIDNPPTVDLGNLPQQVSALSVMALSLIQLSPMGIWLNVPSGVQNDVISIPVMIHIAAFEEFESFGLDLHFDPTFFELDNVEKGMLTQKWAACSGNEVDPGLLRLGGYVGDPANLSDGEIGSIIIVKLKVLGTGGTSNIAINSYVDGIENFKPNPCTAVFTYGE